MNCAPRLLKPGEALTDEAYDMAAMRRTWAYPLAALGGVGLASSLWLPWY
jgi:hypothetical protein